MTPQAENSDVFWTLRGGGGGNIAAVTEFTARTHPAPRYMTASSLSGTAPDMAGFKVLLQRVLKLLAESNTWPLDQQCTSGAPHWNMTTLEASFNCRHYEGDTGKIDALYKPVTDWCAEPAQQALGIHCSSRAEVYWNQSEYNPHSKIFDNASFIPHVWVGNEPWISFHADREISTALLGSLSKYIPMRGCTNDTLAAEMVEGIIKIEALLHNITSAGSRTGVKVLGVGSPTGDKSQSGMPPAVVARSKQTAVNPVLRESPAFWLIMINIPSLPQLPPSSRVLKSLWPVAYSR